MSAWTNYPHLLGPVTALIVVGILALLLRWTFRRGASLVPGKPRPGDESDYGLLVSIASPASYVEGELLRRRLADAGVTATLAQTTHGPRLMVWPQDEHTARSLLAQQ